MADTAQSTGAENFDNETPTQRQARLRREKRQKKMNEQGEDRLAKIKSLNGGVAPSDDVLGGPLPPTSNIVDDPEEVDISLRGGFVPADSRRTPAPNPRPDFSRQLSQPPLPGTGQDGAQDDPMAKMMQQMMGMLGGQQPGSDPNNPPIPEALQSLLKNMQNGGAGAPGASGQTSTPAASSAAFLWKIVHFVFAVSLGVYVALTTPFNGTHYGRTQAIYSPDVLGGQFLLGPRLAVLFTSAELVLQSTRYFLEGGELQGGGMLASITNSGFIPPPYNNYIRIAGRYLSIAQTIFKDVMVLVFVLGCVALWHGDAAGQVKQM